ncbi:MAG TPA: response regulator transcription factor [Gemmatimonadales bacterium]
MRALIVDDEAPARRRLRAALRGLPAITEVGECGSGSEALELIRRQPLDLAFLDIEMPDLDGLAVAAEVRARRTPALVFVTAYEQYAVRAFEVEALDYLLKPLDDERVAEAVRRVEVYLSFVRQGGPPPVDRFGAIAVEYAAHAVSRNGRRLELRPKEYALLVALLRRGGAVASRGELLREVWGYADSVTSRTVDTHVGALRKRLEPDPVRPRYILTVRQYGYRLERGGWTDR